MLSTQNTTAQLPQYQQLGTGTNTAYPRTLKTEAVNYNVRDKSTDFKSNKTITFI